MRYIGNKTKLLEFIGSVLDEYRITQGRALDAFAGTASVGRYLKRRGFAVSACDIMMYSYVFQKAYIELDRVPSFAGVYEGDTDLRAALQSPAFQERLAERFPAQGDLFGGRDAEYRPFQQVLLYLDGSLPDLTSFITRHYAPAEGTDEPGDRMFFTRATAQRIDAIRTRIHEWRTGGLLSEPEFFLLLACLIEAADAVANTTGVYAAYVKSWQSNARRPLRLNTPELVVGTGLPCRAYRGDVNRVIQEVGALDLLYLDPPYNTRQYSSYYHVPEVIAQGWFEGEPELRGKTGLIPDHQKKSVWSTSAGCVSALRDLIRTADARYVLLSYNSEGIIPEDAIREIFCEFGRAETYRVHQREYARYRADRDHEKRRYKGDRVTENIYFVELEPVRSGALLR